ncbi:VPS4-associated protein 1 [Glomus cerebriforme]|uniref:VPS4-associated protein 1 n=1 Tax=Glomus cerebriforme TaxID=658196 RepID=A0A397TE95_9GLOM|nr:VPS4-associated protein 1 [Glomus cerebriforme]
MSNKTNQFINLYTHRIATTDKPCYICNKYTKSVLRTDNGLDWFYTCESHLSDRGFATPILEPEPKPLVVQSPTKAKVSQKDDSSKSKSDSDSNQYKDKSNDSIEVEGKQQQEGKEEKKKEEKIKDQTEENQQVATPKSPEPPRPTKPKQYKLHSNIFYLREDNLNKKRQKAEVQNILSKLPSVPKNSLQ